MNETPRHEIIDPRFRSFVPGNAELELLYEGGRWLKGPAWFGDHGTRLNAPNDVIVKSDGTVWFTDPHYGIETDYEGGKATPELPRPRSTASIRATGRWR